MSRAEFEREVAKREKVEVVRQVSFVIECHNTNVNHWCCVCQQSNFWLLTISVLFS